MEEQAAGTGSRVIVVQVWVSWVCTKINITYVEPLALHRLGDLTSAGASKAVAFKLE